MTVEEIPAELLESAKKYRQELLERVAEFDDEALNLFPQNEDGRVRRLAQQTFLLSEFLEKKAVHFSVPRLVRKALVHGHCHQKSVMKMTDEEAVLKKMGVDFQAPATGCCGMAGAFGFEKDKYETSVAVGELELLPAVREASLRTLIIADGFSCREQIAQSTDRHALHLADVLQMALREGPLGPDGNYPEEALVRSRQTEVRRSMRNAGLAMAGAAAGVAALFYALRK